MSESLGLTSHASTLASGAAAATALGFGPPRQSP